MANIVNGTDLRFYKAGTAIGEATSCQMSFTMETRSVLTKDNVGSFTRVEAGQRSATGSFQGLIAYDTTNESVSDLYDSYKNGEKFILRFTDDSNGHPYWEGTAMITQIDFEAGVEANAGYSGTFTFDGEVSRGTES